MSRMDKGKRMPTRARPSEVASAAVAARWTPEGRVRTALRELVTADLTTVKAVCGEMPALADVAIKRLH